MESSHHGWRLQPEPGYLRDQRWYAKKRPRELQACLRNLERFMTLLSHAPHPLAVQAGFLHPESHGMVALDQRGGGANLAETRLYILAHAPSRVVHLLGIGSKSTQAADLSRLIPLARELNF
jgi:hypothetical protein